MSTSETYDVVIVGAGIAGAVIALQLGKEGKRVLILESGQGFKAGTSREEYLLRFYSATAKTPESPYPAQAEAQRPLTLEVFNYRRGKEGLELCPGRESYLDQEGSQLPFSSTYERQGGGTVWHWLGTCLRMLPHDFKLNTRYGKGMDWPLGYDDLVDDYGAAEHLIGVSANAADQAYHGITFPNAYDYPMKGLPPSVVDRTIASGIDGREVDGQKIRVRGTPAGRNSVPRGDYNNGRRICAGNTSCVPICPIQAKYDPTVTLGQALQTGNVTILNRTVATNIELDPASGEVAGIDYVTYTADGDRSTGRALGHRYVLAASGIEVPKLLLISNKQRPEGVANSSDQVGRNLMDHPALNTWARAAQPVYPFRGPNATSGIEDLRDGSFRSERSAFRVEIHNVGWNWPTLAPYSDLAELVDSRGLVGEELRRALNDSVTRQLDMNFLFEQLPRPGNRVTLSEKHDALGLPRPRIAYDLHEYEKKSFAAARKIAADLYGYMGAEDKTGFADARTRPNFFEFDREGYVFEGAGHVIGTYRMGASADDSVVDREQRSWDHKNLFLVGSGVFPTSATSNPTLTIVALCLRAARTLLADLR